MESTNRTDPLFDVKERVAMNGLKELTAALPSLGDPALVSPVNLSESEINAIHFVVNFFISACEGMTGPFSMYYEKLADHYGPTLEALSDRLRQEIGKAGR